MKKIALFAMLLSIIPLPVFPNISLSPFFLEFDADSKNKSGQVRFTNSTSETRTYNIKLVNFKQNKDGSYTTITAPVDGNPSADYYLEYSPRQVSLPSMKSQVVRVQRRGMAGAAPGEYVSHLLVQEVPKEKKSENKKPEGISIDLKVVYGISIPVIITKGSLSASARIKSAKISKKDHVAEVEIERSGDRSFFGSIIIKDNGSEIGKISDFRIFTTTKSRVLKVPLSKNPSGEASATLIDGRTGEIAGIKGI
ncbi:MAG: hypothetical protein LBG89_03090 [Rickettsiales bacterium]|jgi:P pilus assembly chaperone PapD|nr:hypothetical protein [Rickettsiales bacterium]